MCPPACTGGKEERAVSDRGLTGNLISTCLRFTSALALPEYTTVRASGGSAGWTGLLRCWVVITTATLSHRDTLLRGCPPLPISLPCSLRVECECRGNAEHRHKNPVDSHADAHPVVHRDDRTHRCDDRHQPWNRPNEAYPLFGCFGVSRERDEHDEHSANHESPRVHWRLDSLSPTVSFAARSSQ